jgi:hypothetical protein
MHRTGPQAGAGPELVLDRHGPHAGEKEAGQPGPVGRNLAHEKKLEKAFLIFKYFLNSKPI